MLALIGASFFKFHFIDAVTASVRFDLLAKLSKPIGANGFMKTWPGYHISLSHLGSFHHEHQIATQLGVTMTAGLLNARSVTLPLQNV